METLEWSELRERANTLFGQFPNAQTEQDILDVFMVWPQQIKSLIEQVAVGVQSGKVRSGWAVLRHEALRSHSDRNATVTDSGERDKKIRQAEAWIRSVGLHFDREQEIVGELFERSYLRAWDGDDQLRERMVELWEQLRPRGERVEREAIERAEAYKKAHDIQPPRLPKEVLREL